MVCSFLVVHIPSERLGAQAAQKDFQGMTVGYTPFPGRRFRSSSQSKKESFKIWLRVFPRSLWEGRRLLIPAILAGEFPIGYTGGGAIISSRLAGSDLIAIASPPPVLTIDELGKARDQVH